MWAGQNYLKNQDGNVAVMFSICLVGLLMGVGLAADYTSITREKNALQSQVDAAVFAAATVDVTTDEEGQDLDESQEKQIREKAALEVIKANGFDASLETPSLELTDHSVTLTASTNFKPAFGALFGKKNIRISAVAETGFAAMTRLDVVLVVDNTKSMEIEGKMDALKEGATSLIDAIEESNSGSRVGLVPFARYVKLDQSLSSKTWLDVPAPFSADRTSQKTTSTGGTCRTEPNSYETDGVIITRDIEVCTGQITTEETVTETVESEWQGCVGTRIPPFSEQDGSYVHKIPGLPNKLMKEQSGLDWDVGAWCPAEIEPLTDDYDKLKNRVSWLSPTDSTYIPTGLIWGQRVLSPGEPFDNKPESGEDANRQVMILMTDGKNTTEIMQDAQSVQKKKAPPYIAKVNTDPKTAPAADAATARLCTNVKNSGIEIYTIAFKVKDPTTKALLRNCASDPSHALTAESNESLVKQFEKISNKLKDEVRLIR